MITGTTCVLPQTLATWDGEVGGTDTYTCTFTVAVSGNPQTITDIVTATGTEIRTGGRTVTGEDSAQVIITPVPALIELIKTAVPDQVAEPGGNVTYSFVVTNLSIFETVTVTSLTDNVLGDLTTFPGTTCGVSFTLSPAEWLTPTPAASQTS